MTTLNVAAALSGLVVAVALAGCSSGNHDMAPQVHAAEAPSYQPASVDYMPNYMASTSSGLVMTTPQGSTVYTFDKDQGGMSSCYGDCARHWPPVLANDTAQAYGRMTLAARQDGQQQWAHDGKPLYTYADDAMYGDVKGDNAGEVWHVVK
jgi:predicted lipoprotein with Yx(FWY)xxD motif